MKPITVFRNMVGVIVMLLSPVTIADEKIIGHITPLENETLTPSMKLNCGVEVEEWRGSPLNFQLADKLCSASLEHFPQFIAMEGMTIPRRERPFIFKVSFIPDNKQYRNLNDVAWRFRYRPQQEDVWGYTSYTNEFIFTISDTGIIEFRRTFTHELFHAMSYYFGVLDRHPGNYEQRLIRDEELAIRFAKQLTGY